jgi:hypothetical protein
MSLRPTSVNAIPAWTDTADPSLLDYSTHNVEKGIGFAIPSQGNSPHGENKVARTVPRDAAPIHNEALESPNIGNVASSLLVPLAVEQASILEAQLEEKLERERKRKESFKSVALNPSTSNFLEVSVTVGDTRREDKQETIM